MGDEAGERLQRIEHAAMRLLAGREHSRLELARKLSPRFDDRAAIDQVIARLEALQLLSDQRFAAAYAGSRLRRGFGPVRIALELRERGIDAELVEETLAALEVDWQQQISAICRQKFGAQPAGDRREQARRGRFLEQRGFSAAAIRELLLG